MSTLVGSVHAKSQSITQETQKERMEEDADLRWRVGGANGIKVDDLVLVGLQHVSKGSWQAYVRLRGHA